MTPITDDKLAERICHKEQLGIWSNEIATAISLGDFLKEDWTFDDSVDLDREIAAQLLDIIKSALTHPELNVTERLQAAEQRISAYEEALEPFAEVAPRIPGGMHDYTKVKMTAREPLGRSDSTLVLVVDGVTVGDFHRARNLLRKEETE